MTFDRRSLRALVVEDSASQALAARKILASEGFSFFRQRCAAGARGALDGPGRFALALVDVGIPEHEGDGAPAADGLSLCRVFLERDPSLVVIAWSADVTPFRRSRALCMGFELVSKDDAAESIRRACAEARRRFSA